MSEANRIKAIMRAVKAEVLEIPGRINPFQNLSE